MVFGTLEGEDFSQYKIGNEVNSDTHLMLDIAKKLFPTKINQIGNVLPCFYSNYCDEEFIFEKKGKTIYAFSDCGRGFKHMGYHGKRIYHLVMDNF